MSFQFNGFGSQSSPAAPRFAVPTVAAPPAGAEDGEDEESDEEEEKEEFHLKLEEKTTDVEKEVKGEEGEDEGLDKAEKVEVKTPEISEEKQDLWQVDESVNGIETMSNAFVDTVQPSLDATIYRIAELKENQQVRYIVGV